MISSIPSLGPQVISIVAPRSVFSISHALPPENSICNAAVDAIED